MAPTAIPGGARSRAWERSSASGSVRKTIPSPPRSRGWMLTAADARDRDGSGGVLAGQSNGKVAGEPGALMVPARAGLVAAPPVRLVLGMAGPGGPGGEQAGDLRDGQRVSPGSAGGGCSGL